MSGFIAEIPDVIVKSGRMDAAWARRARSAALLAAMLLYAYLLLLAKSMYLREERLDKIADHMVDTHNIIGNLKRLDHQLEAGIEGLDKLLPPTDY